MAKKNLILEKEKKKNLILKRKKNLREDRVKRRQKTVNSVKSVLKKNGAMPKKRK